MSHPKERKKPRPLICRVPFRYAQNKLHNRAVATQPKGHPHKAGHLCSVCSEGSRPASLTVVLMEKAEQLSALHLSRLMGVADPTISKHRGFPYKIGGRGSSCLVHSLYTYLFCS